jgi:two-component system sensor histidine kinase ChiS
LPNVGELSEVNRNDFKQVQEVNSFIPVDTLPSPLSSKTICSDFHILIVDDEPVNRMVLECFLKVKNYRVSQCSSGLEALAYLLKDDSVSLVLLDVMMPRFSGFETCKKIRDKYLKNELPVIFLTGMNRHSDLEVGYSVGGSDFLTKPVSREELLSRVETQLRLTKNFSINQV